MLWYLRKKCNSPFGFLNIGRLLIGCVSESNNQKRQKIWLNGFFENTRWRKLFQNCTIFQFLRHYEFCLYLFLRGVNGKGEIGKIMPLTLALMRTQWGSNFTFFFSWKHNRIISKQQQKNVIMDNLWEFLLPNFPNPKKIWKIYMKNGRL